MYSKRGIVSGRESDQLDVGAEFPEANTALSLQQERRLKQMGATVRNASAYMKQLKLCEEREKVAKAFIGKMSIEQISDLTSLYRMMSRICSEAWETKFHDLLLENDAD